MDVTITYKKRHFECPPEPGQLHPANTHILHFMFAQLLAPDIKPTEGILAHAVSDTTCFLAVFFFFFGGLSKSNADVVDLYSRKWLI